MVALVGSLVGLLPMGATTPVAAGAAPPDEPVDPAAFDFVRRQAEIEATAYFTAIDPTVANVSCAAPDVDSAGGQMVCFATVESGAVLTATATINDDGGIDLTERAGGTTAVTVPPSAPAVTELGSFQGSGAAVQPVDVITEPTIVRVSHAGAGPFSVVPQQGGVAASEPLFEATGAWTGRYLVGLGGTISSFAVTADGAWTLDIESIDSAVSITQVTPAGAEAPDVVRFSDIEAVPVNVEYAGTDPILISAVVGSRTEVLVDEPGAFAGEVTLPAGPGYLSVSAVGAWTITSATPPPSTAAAATTSVPPITPAPTTPTPATPTPATTTPPAAPTTTA